MRRFSISETKAASAARRARETQSAGPRWRRRGRTSTGIRRSSARSHASTFGGCEVHGHQRTEGQREVRARRGHDLAPARVRGRSPGSAGPAEARERPRWLTARRSSIRDLSSASEIPAAASAASSSRPSGPAPASAPAPPTMPPPSALPASLASRARTSPSLRRNAASQAALYAASKRAAAAEAAREREARRDRLGELLAVPAADVWLRRVGVATGVIRVVAHEVGVETCP